MIDTHNNAPPFSPFGSIKPTEYVSLSHNLLVLFAFSVFENALKQIRAEGHFSSKKDSLKCMMDASKQTLPWKDYPGSHKKRKLRNKIAHDQELAETGACKATLSVIEDELISWGILPRGIKGSYSISIS